VDAGGGGGGEDRGVPEEVRPELGEGGGLRAEDSDPGFRTGADLIGDEAGSKALYEEREVAKGEKRAASRHEQEVDVADVRSGKIDDSIQAIDDYASLTEVDDRYKWRPDRCYYHGWTKGEQVILLYKTETGARKREVVEYPFYFFVRASEAEEVPPESWDWLVRKRGWADRVEPDPEFPEYWRVYVERSCRRFDPKYQFSRIGEDSARWAIPFYVGERPQPIRFPLDRDRWTDFHKVVNWLRKKGVEPLEADLTPKQRFMTDFDLRIQPTYRMMYFDLETDDSVGGFDRKEEARILSVAWQGDRFESDPTDAGFLLLEDETDEAEERLLRAFRDAIKPYDVLLAWNGTGFDFPVLFARFHRYEIRIDWRNWLFTDPLPVFKRHYIRAGSHATSYALDAVGQAVLKIPKIEWRREFAARHPDVPPRFVELYRREPELLERYNRRDVEILRKLEEFTGFVSIEQIFCRIANGFVNDYQISTKVDQLLLKKGRKEGFHYPSRFWSPSKPEQYEGAYVFPPVVGMHDNVGSFDFKSLYPSMVRSFNISPETIVKRDRWGKAAEAGVPTCNCPVVEVDEEGEVVEKGGARFRKDVEGFISQMFVQTLERRKKYTDLQDERLKVTGTTQDDLFLLYYRLAYSFKRMGLSFYGDLGNPRSRYYDTELAEAITLSGQYFIKRTAEYALTHGYKTLYGDSITGRRNVVVRDPSRRVRVWPVERLWSELSRDNPHVREDGKEVVEADGWFTLTLTYTGSARWSELGGLVRHRTAKPVYRLSTPEGQVEVTDDHGIVVERGGLLKEATAKEVIDGGYELQRVEVPIDASMTIEEVDLLEEVGPYQRVYERLVSPARHRRSALVSLVGDDELRLEFSGEIGFAPVERARFRRRYSVGTPEMDAILDLLGTFCAEGSVAFDGRRYDGASISMDDTEWIAHLSDCYRLLTNSETGGLTYGGRKLQMRNELTSIVLGRLCGVGASGKRVPDFVFALPDELRQRFLSAYLRGDGSYWRDRTTVGDENCYDGWEACSNSLDLISGIAVLARMDGVPYSVRLPRALRSGETNFGIRTKKLRNIQREWTKRSHRAKPRLDPIEHDGYVYDLNVPETHRFVEALGCVALHNTDSVYIQLAPAGTTWSSEEERIADLLQRGDRFVAYCQERYRELLTEFGCNLDWNSVILEYEDVMDRIFFVTKKRYAGRMLVHKRIATDHVEVKGLEVMRGDTSLLTRRLQQAVLDAVLMKGWDGERIERELIAPEFERVAGGNLPAEEVVISKGVSKEPERYKTVPLHVRLAEWIRDHGQQFFVGMKVEYVVTKAKPKLEGALLEHYDPEVFPYKYYDPEYYWDRVIFPASLRILEVCFPERDWNGWRIEVRDRRAKLVERYKRWFLQPKNVTKAVAQIRENKKNWLGPAELEELRRAPKVKTIR
jgi:DNA polymerase I